MSIRFACPAGHRIKADPRLAGRAARCPACGAGVVVPLLVPPAGPRPEPLSETGALRLLNECPPASACGTPTGRPPLEPAPPRRLEPAGQPRNACPRCGTEVSPSARICSRCRLYLVPAETQWNSVVRAATRYVRGRRAS